MYDQQSDAKSAVVATVAVLQEIITLYEQCGLYAAGAHLSAGLDAACGQTGLDRSDLASPFGKSLKQAPPQR